MKALVIGGTGPTGPYIVEGLLDRGFEVTIYHRGSHEVEFSRPVTDLHGDPFTMSDLERDLAPLRFDAIISNYGRLRYIARVIVGRCDRFIGITSGAGYLGWKDPKDNPNGLPAPMSEDGPLYNDHNQNHFGTMVALSEGVVREEHEKGSYKATLLRYPLVYGPRQPASTLWPIIKRVLDGRKRIIVPGDGLQLRCRGYSENCANAVLLALDNPKAIGQIYNVADEKTYSLKEFVALVVRGLDADAEVVPIAHPMAFNLAQGYASPPYHLMFDMAKAIHELGYRDLVPTPEAVRRSVQWLVSNPSVIDARSEQTLGDSYDYELEDRLIDAYQGAMEHIAESLPSPTPIKPREYVYRTDKRVEEGTTELRG